MLAIKRSADFSDSEESEEYCWILFQGFDSKVIALDIDGAGQVDFLCQTSTGYKLLSWGLELTDGQ